MERLTKKQENKYWLNCSYDEQDAIQQLGKLEDLQDELGIPLEVLFKALKDGIWTNSSKTKREVCLIGDIYNHFCFQDLKYNLYRTKDYGVTWALTREELE